MLFNSAAIVLGPAMHTLNSRLSVSIRPSFADSAYNPSVGRNITAKLVVLGGSIYFVHISLADTFSAWQRAAPEVLTSAGSALSYASISF